MAPKAEATNEKLDKLNFSELNLFVLIHTSSRNKNVYTKMKWLQDTSDVKVILRILRKNSLVGGSAQSVVC